MVSCPCCGGPLCEYKTVLMGEFVLRDGKVVSSYAEECALVAGHRGPHVMRGGGLAASEYEADE